MQMATQPVCNLAMPLLIDEAERRGEEEREIEDVGVTCVNVVANVVVRLPSVLWHLLLLWSAHQARIKCNMNVSVSAVVAAIVVAAHKLRLVLCLCRRAYVAVVPIAVPLCLLLGMCLSACFPHFMPKLFA